jgi:hypothetical protein
MSAGLYLVVDAINAIGAAAVVADGAVQKAAADATAATSALTGAAAATGSQMGGQSGPDAGSNTSGGVTNQSSMTVTVLTPAQLTAELRSLEGRIPVYGNMGGR